MPTISIPAKLPSIFKTHHCKPLSRFKSSFISSISSPVPTHEQISHLILDQKSPNEALHTFKWASNLPHFTHNQSTYRALINKLCKFRRFDIVHDLLDEMPRSIGSPPGEDIFITVIQGLGRARMIKEVVKVLDVVSKFHTPSLKLYNSILDVLVKEDIDLARAFYRNKMMGSGFHGDEYMFGILMKGLCLTNRIGDGFKLLQTMKSRCVKPNTVMYNTLLHALCKNGKIGRARSLMSEMTDPNEVTFNILISAYCGEDDLVHALVLLEKCFNLGFTPNVITITKILELFCDKGRVSEGIEVLERVESKGGVVDIVAYNTIVKGFCKLGKAKIGREFLKVMERKGCFPNVETFNILVSGFCEQGMLDFALDVFNDMKTDGLCWNFVTFDTLIKGLCSKGKVDDGFKVLELMEESNMGRLSISPYNNIIYGLYKENRMDEAFEFLTKMEKLFPIVVKESLMIMGLCEKGRIENAQNVYDQWLVKGGKPNPIVYVCLIHAYCQKCCLSEAFELINEMIVRGFFPVASTFNGLIRAFCRQGLVVGALKLLEDMIMRDFIPDAGSYNPLIDDLCMKGDFKKAIKVFIEMVEIGVLPDHLTWELMVYCLSQETRWVESENLFCIADLLHSY